MGFGLLHISGGIPDMLYICFTLQWATPKSVEITLIHHLADISFYVIKYTLGQVIKVYKIKCPPSGGLG